MIASTTIALEAENMVTFLWQPPEPNGSPVDAYKLEIYKPSTTEPTGSWLEETQHCSGNVDPTVVTAAACHIPMSVFSGAPWSLSQGTSILFRVSAGNVVGWQVTPSSTSTGTVVVQTPPVGVPEPLLVD